MLDLRFVVEHLDDVRCALARRNPEAAAALDPITELANARREAIVASETKAARRNAANQEMARLAKNSEEFAQRRDELKALSAEAKEFDRVRAEAEAKISELLLTVPNLPDASVPDGKGADDNPVVREWGVRPQFDFQPKPHWDLGTSLGIIDFERASKLSGPRFAIMMGFGARLERALISFMLDLHREHGYLEVLPPFLVKDSALRGTGQLPKFEEDLFKTRKSDPERTFDLYLIPTAEVPVTNLHADEVLDGASLPIAYCAYTPCFRSEAGSYGKDVRGLIRQHQFDKVELVRFTTPENSMQQLELLTSHAEEVLKRLGLHYRVVSLCAGDVGFSACKTYDLEVWLPGMDAYREISSCSSFGDFQARRASIRFRAEKGQKPQLVHTINGSGLAVGRTVVALLEQYQQADGSVVIPEALRKYTGFDVIPVPSRS